MADPEPLGAHCDGGQKLLRRRHVRDFDRAVVLDGPEDIESGAATDLCLLEDVVEQPPIGPMRDRIPRTLTNS